MTDITPQEMEAVAAACATPVSIRATYSGRYMYGATCFGIVTRPEGLVQFTLNLMKAHPEVAVDLAGYRMATDNMATEWIYYWPGFQLSGLDEEDE